MIWSSLNRLFLTTPPLALAGHRKWKKSHFQWTIFRGAGHPRMHESEHFIHLHVPGADVPNSRFEYLTRLRRRCVHQRENCVAVQSGEALNGANTHAFQHETESLGCDFGIGIVISQLGSGF